MFSVIICNTSTLRKTAPCFAVESYRSFLRACQLSVSVSRGRRSYDLNHAVRPLCPRSGLYSRLGSYLTGRVVYTDGIESATDGAARAARSRPPNDTTGSLPLTTPDTAASPA